jgi:hypothetical protein
VAYQSQLKARTELSGKLLQEFTVAIKQLAHQSLVGLPKNFIQREVAYAFANGVKD